MAVSKPSSESTPRPRPDLLAPGLGSGILSGYAALTAGILGIGITTALLAHVLGTATFGLWITLSTVVAYAGLADAGFTHAVSRFTGEFRSRGDARALGEFPGMACVLYGTVFVVVLAGPTLAGIGLSLVVRLPAKSMVDLQVAVLFLTFATGMAIWMGAALNLLHAYQRLALTNLIRAGYWTVYTTLAIVTRWLHRGSSGIDRSGCERLRRVGGQCLGGVAPAGGHSATLVAPGLRRYASSSPVQRS